MFEGGRPVETDESRLVEALKAPEVSIHADLGEGDQSATAWGCDLSYDYVKINASYTT